jgi:hypothetical protein
LAVRAQPSQAERAAEWTSVELVESTGGGLSAVHNNVSKPLS